LEERMLFHGNLNSQVASLSSYVSQFALVAQLKHHATFDARWHINLESRGALHSTCSPALSARIADSHALAAARRARRRNLKEPKGFGRFALARRSSCMSWETFPSSHLIRGTRCKIPAG